MGLVLYVIITLASVQDRHGARPLLWNTHRACRRVRLIWADAGYTGQLARASLCRPNYQTLTKVAGGR